MLCLRIAMSKKSFLANSLTPLIHKPKFRPVTTTYGKTIASSFLQNDPQQSPGENDRKLGKLGMVGLPAGMFTLGPIDDASAGRIGSHCFSSSTPTTKRRVITKRPKKNFSSKPAVDRRLIGGNGWGKTFISLLGLGLYAAESFGFGLNLKAILFFMFLGGVAKLLRNYIMLRAEQKRRR